MRISVVGALRIDVDGAAEIEIDADTIYELLSRVAEKYPAMQANIDRGIAVAINGTIFRDDWTQKILPDADVCLLPRISGG